MRRSAVDAGHGSPPNGLMSQICGFPGPASDSGGAGAPPQAMYFPSGDHRGWETSLNSRVSWISAPEVMLESMRKEARVSRLVSGATLTHRAHAPSGEMRN